MIVPAITVYVILVWFLWGFFMALGWALGTWIMGQLLGRWRVKAECASGAPSLRPHGRSHAAPAPLA